MNRYELREQTFRLLFGLTFHEDGDKREAIENYLDETYEKELDPADRKLLTDRVLDIDARLPEIDSRIEAVSKSWKLSRIGRAELCILRLAVYEIGNDDAVPAQVAVNEAVELARSYGNEDAPGFVNGVLAKFIR